MIFDYYLGTNSKNQEPRTKIQISSKKEENKKEKKKEKKFSSAGAII